MAKKKNGVNPLPPLCRETLGQWLYYACNLLYIHGVLSESEKDKVKARMRKKFPTKGT